MGYWLPWQSPRRLNSTDTILVLETLPSQGIGSRDAKHRRILTQGCFSVLVQWKNGINQAAGTLTPAVCEGKSERSVGLRRPPKRLEPAAFPKKRGSIRAGS